MLDTDFTSPQVMLELVRRAVLRAERTGQNELTLTMIGHANNAHTFANLNRILTALRSTYKTDLRYLTVQDVVQSCYRERDRYSTTDRPANPRQPDVRRDS